MNKNILVIILVIFLLVVNLYISTFDGNFYNTYGNTKFRQDYDFKEESVNFAKRFISNCKNNLNSEYLDDGFLKKYSVDKLQSYINRLDKLNLLEKYNPKGENVIFDSILKTNKEDYSTYVEVVIYIFDSSNSKIQDTLILDVYNISPNNFKIVIPDEELK